MEIPNHYIPEYRDILSQKNRRLNVKRQIIIFLGILTLLATPLILVLFVGYSRSQITPNELFFTNSLGPPPELNTDTWNLTIHGHVTAPMIYNYTEILNLPNRSITALLQCVEGYAGTAVWKGVPVSNLLGAVGLRTGAVDVIFHAADGYSSSLPVDEAQAPNVLLAYEMNGEPLPAEQGFPLRVVAPNHLGYKWVMWVIRIEIVDYDYLGYWETRGWSDSAHNTPFTQWGIHAVLFSIAFLFGGLAYISGVKFSPGTSISRDLFPFITSRFHRVVALLYNSILLITFTYWALQTLILRNALFYTIHGIAAFFVILVHSVGAILGHRRFMRDPAKRTWHNVLNTLAFLGLILTITLGFFLTIGIRFLPN